jgi:hypothetical protein
MKITTIQNENKIEILFGDFTLLCLCFFLFSNGNLKVTQLPQMIDQYQTMPLHVIYRSLDENHATDNRSTKYRCLSHILFIIHRTTCFTLLHA